MIMNEKRIEIGDTVNVLFSRAGYVYGVVDYMPCGAGDSWIILDSQTGTPVPVYVQNFDRITLQKKGGN